MPAVNLSPIFNGWQAFTSGGLPLAGGLLNTYVAGSSTPQTSYTNSGGTIANSNPIVLDAAGRLPAELWLVAGVSYKFILTDSLGASPLSYDNISGIGDFINLIVGGNSILGTTGSTLNVSNGAITVASGNTAIGGNLTVAGNTTLGDNAIDVLTVYPSAITWVNNPTHSGNHTFTGSITGATTLSNTGNATLGDAAADVVTINGTTTFPLAVVTHTFGSKFGNVARADTSTLDWYEEGTFTPVLNGIGTPTYSTQQGTFTRVGNVVAFEILIVWTAGTATAITSVTGLPYTVTTGVNTIPVAVLPNMVFGGLTWTGSPMGNMQGGSGAVFFSFPASGAASGALTNVAAGTKDLRISGVYTCN